MSSVALVRDAQGYRLIPTAEAVAAGSADWARDPSAGYGISVIPLQFVSAQTLMQTARQLRSQGRHGSCRAVTQPDYYPGKQRRPPSRHPDRAELSMPTG